MAPPEHGSIGRFADARAGWLRRYFPLPDGVPGHDTFDRVSAAVDRTVLAACFGRWMAGPSTATGLTAVAIDGTSCRPAPNDALSGRRHLVGAWGTENGSIFGREAVPDGGRAIASPPPRCRPPWT